MCELCEQEQDNVAFNSLQPWAYQPQKLLNFSTLVKLSFSENMLRYKMLLYSITKTSECAYTLWNDKDKNEFMTEYSKISENNFFRRFFLEIISGDFFSSVPRYLLQRQ